jgi:hypothetical protein
VADARPRDARVLDEDRRAVAEHAPAEHGRCADGTDANPEREQHAGGQAEPDDGEPAGRQPLQRKLGDRHRRAPQQAGGSEGCERGAAVEVHAGNHACDPIDICQSTLLTE